LAIFGKNESNSETSLVLAGRCALVTGGGRGIGAAVAEELLRRGARVFLCARTASEVEAVVTRLQAKYGTEKISGVSFDLERAEALPTLLDQAEAAFGRPSDLLINNAAIGYVIPFLETPPEKLREEWDQMSAINIRAPLLLAHEFMRRSLGGGAIVNLGSLGGIRGTEKFPGLTPYVATKFAVAGLTEALAVEGRSIGVRVNAVAPGAVDTDMLRKAAPHLKTETGPRDIAKVIADLCDPIESKSVTGMIFEIHSNL